jgi:hypothetical protein
VHGREPAAANGCEGQDAVPMWMPASASWIYWEVVGASSGGERRCFVGRIFMLRRAQPDFAGTEPHGDPPLAGVRPPSSGSAGGCSGRGDCGRRSGPRQQRRLPAHRAALAARRQRRPWPNWGYPG